MEDLLTKIAESFPRHPHLRLAVCALAMVGEDKLLKAGDVKGFEEWAYAHPKMHGNYDTCRHFLQALAPLRFNHSHKSFHWENVTAMFPQACDALVEALRDANLPPIALDFAPWTRLGLQRPGKRARAALEVAEQVITAFAAEKGAKLVPAEGRAENVPCFSFMPSLTVTKTYTVRSTTDISVITEQIAEAIEASGRALALTEEDGKRVHELPGVGELSIGFPVHATEYDQAEMAQEMEFLAKLLFADRP